MIIVNLEGGIGNQLFQYAVGRHLSILNNTSLGFDITSFESDQLRSYLLSKFNIEGILLRRDEVDHLRMRPPSFPERVFRRFFRLPPRSTSTHIKEKNRDFDPNILKLGDGVYLEGYWQSASYFSDVAGQIRDDLELRNILSEDAERIAGRIKSTVSVSLHIRRGDYVSDAVVNKKHGTCSLDYYHRCVKRMGNWVTSPSYFVFSDDPDWVRSNFKLDYPMEIVDCNGLDNPEFDLKLMSLCKNNIIANSSFSWWGAWLNSNPDKLVMAPSRWLRIRRSTKDLFPEGWVIIESD